VSRIRLVLALLAASTIAGVLGGAVLGGPLPALAAPAGARVDLRVLVLADGGYPSAAIAGRLAAEGVPYDQVNLWDAARPTIDAGFLADVVDGAERAKYQAVVLPNDNPFGNSAEFTALADYERHFGIRQVDAYLWPTTNVGLAPPIYAGPLDGITATVTEAGRSGAFGYLRGPVPFEDNDPAVAESYGFPAPPAPGAAFTPLLTGTAPGGTDSGVLIGQYDADGRSQLVMTFAYNAAQEQFGLLGHGIVTWLTGGVHLGHYRNYLSVNVDDVFLPDSRWSTTGNCTPGEDCLGGETTEDIRMTPADVANAAAWQQSHGFTLDLLFNAGGSDEAVAASGTDPLTTALLAAKDSFRWTNHTYAHQFLGCVQDFTVRPWRCATDPATGAVLYASQADVAQQVADNVAWGTQHGLALDPTELVTGEHSGMRLLPQQPDDNPNLAPGLAATGIAWLGSDHSRDPAQRTVGLALTVSRYPVNVFYNAATEEEEVDEYNWIYTSRANGGSGLCEDHPDVMTCIAPVNPGTGYADYIVPLETRLTLAHVLGNDPRPHFVHQSNLTEDRLLYPLLDSVLGSYRTAFADNAPLVCDRLSASGETLRRQADWNAAIHAGTVTGYVRDGVVTVTAPAGLDVPFTVPDGTRVGGPDGELFGTAYAGAHSGYLRSTGTSALTLALPG